MEKLNREIEDILYERFGKDSLISLATISNGIHYARTVDAYCDDSAFYVLSHTLSGKMQQIAKNPVVAISGDWFTAHGNAKNMGWFCLESNQDIAAKMRRLFTQ